MVFAKGISVNRNVPVSFRNIKNSLRASEYLQYKMENTSAKFELHALRCMI